MLGQLKTIVYYLADQLSHPTSMLPTVVRERSQLTSENRVLGWPGSNRTLCKLWCPRLVAPRLHSRKSGIKGSNRQLQARVANIVWGSPSSVSSRLRATKGRKAASRGSMRMQRLRPDRSSQVQALIRDSKWTFLIIMRTMQVTITMPMEWLARFNRHQWSINHSAQTPAWSPSRWILRIYLA